MTPGQSDYLSRWDAWRRAHSEQATEPDTGVPEGEIEVHDGLNRSIYHLAASIAHAAHRLDPFSAGAMTVGWGRWNPAAVTLGGIYGRLVLKRWMLREGLGSGDAEVLWTRTRADFAAVTGLGEDFSRWVLAHAFSTPMAITTADEPRGVDLGLTVLGVLGLLLDDVYSDMQDLAPHVACEVQELPGAEKIDEQIQAEAEKVIKAPKYDLP